ncbi:hypothetical protein DYU11_26405 [Fibrisoma montanum]|uniref:Uncharacterized protein n=1 Tax=Fibrisoma montanum TaxID=2305895 RepID=A0A418M035_9BACT|nr:hypothetical protein [Fibrisoma montanum]RIV19032.1 hypothetical protein DYU11_26405 [Fibrisoma montanum]
MEATKLTLTLLGLLIASGLLTYFTRNDQPAFINEPRKKKHHKKERKRELQPRLLENGVVVLSSEREKRLWKEKQRLDDLFEDDMPVDQRPAQPSPTPGA